MDIAPYVKILWFMGGKVTGLIQRKMVLINDEEESTVNSDAHGANLANISPEIASELLQDALAWASLHGLIVADKTIQGSGKVTGVGLVHAPFSLLPSPLSEAFWRQACALAPLFNELVDRVSMDAAFLQASLSRTKELDGFIAKLLNIHSTVITNKSQQDVRLGLHRSDYMLDMYSNKLLQIELNTISASFAGLSCRITELHRYLIDLYGKSLRLASDHIPENTATQKFAEGLALAWKEFNDKNSVILVVVQQEEHNMYDQHWISIMLKKSFGISCIRKTLSEVHTEGELSSNQTLYIGKQSVAVVYYRAGYGPQDYPSEAEWNARLMLEQSSAIKCPTISYHLAGTKKIQQELAKPGVLERFVENKDDMLKLRGCFAGLWSLEDKRTIERAIQQPDDFVLKPQREGGGNNIYGNGVREKLLEMEQSGYGHAAYILMQRIFPSLQKSYLVRNGMYQHSETVSELGIYGVYLRSKNKVLMNEQGGYLLRTKVSTSNEGGVAAGFAVLDGLYLI